MREVEVLREELIRLFESDPSLEPRDVLVATPDIETYAPFVEAVFGDARFPYQVADRGLRASHEVADAFVRVLEVLEGRFGATAVADLLMLPRVRMRFGIREEDLERLLGWIEGARIHWAVDAGHRGQVGQPRTEQNTWRRGLDSLLLGLALRADEDAAFAGLLPAAVDLSVADLLGRFGQLCETLFELRERLAGARPVADWAELLTRILEATVDRADAADQHAAVRGALADLARRAGEARFEEPVALASVRSELVGGLEREAPSHRFLAGGVTVCEMVPLRSIPFRVVALLGMDDESYPRRREPLGFDRIADRPEPGDRTVRDDDRYLFLEALVSARDHLVVTYTGRSPRDGSAREPSVVVRELLEQVPGARVTKHPLQSFSPRYFDGSDPRLVSHSRGDCAGARALLAGRAAPDAPGPWVTAPLALDASGERVVELSRLARFFEHPTRAFLQERLGLYLRDDVPQLEDREPLELDALDRWKLSERMLARLVAGASPETARCLLRAEGLLPLGAAGELAAEQAEASAGDLVSAVRQLQQGPALPAVEVDLELAGWRVVGSLGPLHPGGLVDYQLSQLPHRRELAFWLRHLVLCCVPGHELPRASFLVGRRSREGGVAVLELPRVPDAESHLADLLSVYELGLEVPLPLLPRASRAQADRGRGDGWSPRPAPAAVNAWTSSFGRPAEDADPYLRQAFRDVDVLDEACRLPGDVGFAALARRLYEPYLDVRVERP